jgi:hypothetical protein
MRGKLIGSGAALLGLIALVGAATVPVGFEATLLTDQLTSPKGIAAAQFRAGAGQMGKYLMVAESGMDQIVEVDRVTGETILYSGTMGDFPVGVSCFGGPFGPYMYVGNAMSGGIVRIDNDGFVEPYALPMLQIAGLDFGKGQFGKYLYAGEWGAGKIWRVDRFGAPDLFTEIPFCQTRYLKFSPLDEFDHLLYFTDYFTGDVYRVFPDGTYEVFANTGSMAVEGLAFSPGGIWGEYLFVGDIASGEIFRIAPDGTVELWASGFEGVADIIFLPGKRGGFKMYIVDGHSSVYVISPI